VVFIIAAIVAPVGDCSIAMTRDCLEPGSAFGRVVSSVADSEGFAAITGSFEAGDDFFATVDIEILLPVDSGVAAAPPKPRVGHEASGAGSLGAFRARVSTVPLQSRSNASHFWIMLLLSLGAFEHEMIEVGRRLQSYDAVIVEFSRARVGGTLGPSGLVQIRQRIRARRLRRSVWLDPQFLDNRGPAIDFAANERAELFGR
jgi:hypothetical protein